MKALQKVGLFLCQSDTLHRVYVFLRTKLIELDVRVRI
jgi:hypothetical protein